MGAVLLGPGRHPDGDTRAPEPTSQPRSGSTQGLFPVRRCGDRVGTGGLFPLGGVTTPDQSNDQVDDDDDVDQQGSDLQPGGCLSSSCTPGMKVNNNAVATTVRYSAH